MKFNQVLIVAAIAISTALSVDAQQAARDHSAHHPDQAGTASTAASQSEGEVRKINLDQGKITLRHGPLANLDMPAMTMVFTVGDPRLLEGLKPGDKVRFTADKKDGVYIVTALALAR